MEQEVALLRDRLSHTILYRHMGCTTIYTGQLYGVEVVLAKSGIGKVSAALGTTLLLDHFKPELVINTGSAGGLVPSLQVGDIVVSSEVCYHDVDITAFGYALGQIAQCPVLFNATPSLVTLAERIIDRLNMHAIRGLIVSGDSFINGSQGLTRIRQNFPLAIAVDMEAASIAHVCYQFAVPFVVVRAISDMADKASHMSFKKGLIIAAQSSCLLIDRMVQEFY